MFTTKVYMGGKWCVGPKFPTLPDFKQWAFMVARENRARVFCLDLDGNTVGEVYMTNGNPVYVQPR